MNLADVENQFERRTSRISAVIQELRQKIKKSKPVVEGRLVRMVGLTLEAVGCQAAIGSRCRIVPSEGASMDAEVVGFSDAKLFLMAVTDSLGLMPESRVIPLPKTENVRVGEGLLGRVIDGAGVALDQRGPILTSAAVPLEGIPINPLDRNPIDKTFDVGIRAVNALLTVGRGQRMGLFSGSGVGKSTLLGLMTRHAEADVVVVGLIGERGREVQEFIQHTLGPEGLARAVVVATPADSPPLMRVHGALRATAIAEYFRSQGKNVLLLMDSLTRFAQAQREIALSIGEMPVSRGYPPSVFAKLPRLVERAGNGNGNGGSITAIYTVLVEGDDLEDPVADAARAILDGHIMLSRKLAESGLYPAVDVEASVSRLMTHIATPEQLANVQRFRELNSTYEQNRDLISVGAYNQGSDARIDAAIAAYPYLRRFISQGLTDKSSLDQSLEDFSALVRQSMEPNQANEVA
ncbi:MAG: flagellar protein export ATPase FliI [Gammaproteobacteria bacterium]|nr:flagellar protein export ATPase FliI [Gammaproteobacteria bacterium]